MKLTKNLLVKEVLERNNQLIDVFNNQGFRGLDNPHVLKQIGNQTLEQLLKSKNKNVDIFIEMLEEALKEDNIDVTLNQSQNNGNIDILGLLPCPVRLPMLESFNELEESKLTNYTLKAASEGLDWLKDSVTEANNEDDLADIYISAGFDLFFEESLMKQYKDDKVFHDYNYKRSFNKNFDNDNIKLQDPNNDYSMIAVVPAVFLVNTMVLGDRPIPKTWEDLFDPIYENSISLPVSDFDLFNAIMIHLYKEFGKDSITRLGNQLIASMHPSEMVKSERRSRVKPAISIMPYFFTKMALPGSVMKAVWPEDGAIVSPIFMLTKSKKEDILTPYADFFSSKEVGEILSHKGLFPSTHPEVNNNLEDKQFKWIGWDYINNNNIGEILEECMALFEKGLRK